MRASFESRDVKPWLDFGMPELRPFVRVRVTELTHPTDAEKLAAVRKFCRHNPTLDGCREVLRILNQPARGGRAKR